MFDLDTLHYANDRAYEEYQKREKPGTPLGVLRERLRNVRPPSLSILINLFQNAETYNDFVRLIRTYLPEREKEILEKPTPHEQMALFASHFEDRYLPLHPSFKLNEYEDDYCELLRDIPVMVMGFGWEDYHDLNNARDGVQLMSYLFQTPEWGDEQDGARVSLVDGFPPQYQTEVKRVPSRGITLKAARRIFVGKKWKGLRNWAEYINMDTGNWFLDTDDETRGNCELMDWFEKGIIEGMSKDWLQAQAFYGKMMDFASWLEDKTKGPDRFKETVDFMLAHLKKGDLPEPTPPACSRGIFFAPRAQNT